MQGQRSIFDPFPETVDLNQGSNSNTMDESDDWDNMLSPMERRLLNNDLSNELNFTCVNTPVNHNYHSFSSWDVGESSSQASLQEPISNNNWPPSFGAHNSRIEEQLESSIHPRDSFAIGPSTMQNTVSNNIPRNVNLNIGYSGSNSDDDGPGFMDLYKSGRPEMDPEHGPDPSLGHWGLSCKRKALDGTSGPSSSSCFPQHEHVVRPVSSGLVNPVPEPLNTRIPESSQTQYGSRDSIPYNNNISSTGNPTRRPIFANRPISLNEFLDRTVSISANSSNHSNPQPPLMHVPSVPRNTHPFPWGNNIGSRGGSSSSSVQPERGSESTFRSLLRNNMQYHNFVPSSDPTNWSLATGNSSTNGGGASSSSRNGLGSGPSGSGSGPGHFNGVWRPQHGPTMQSQQRLSELPAWTLFPSADLESGGQRGNFPPFPAGSSSTLEDNHVSSGVHRQRRHHHQPFSRAGLLMEVPGDDWRVLAADIEGRQRLVSEIRQVLNAMRRGENLRAEDYMLFDPFINGVAELHDRHRDMRLDVDNMSYEELLALEERIGNVNTGLSEEVILKLMKQRKHIAFMAISTQHLEPCCICQEQYETGDDIGRLDCGHDFHRDCIKQWLAQKNICPICKMTGLAAT